VRAGDRELEIFRRLLAVPSPTGREAQLAAVVRRHVEGIGLECQADGAGNLAVALPGSDSTAGTLVLASHMDEIAMVVTGLMGDGSLFVDRSGGLLPQKIGEGPVLVLGDRGTATGVLSMGSAHRHDAEDMPPRFSDCRIITDLDADGIERLGIRPGSTVVPTPERRGPVFLGQTDDPLVGAWTFDDRMGVAVLLRLLEEAKAGRVNPRRPLVVGFTVHEEIGCHGAKVLANRVRPEIFVAVDGCPMPPGTNLELDGRPAVWSKDTVAYSDQSLVAALIQAAREAGTEAQVAVYETAASDASKVYEAGAAERVVTFGHVRENSHGFEVARLSVFANVTATLAHFVERV
jgi:putative aminopeptidase FrvX